MTTTRATTAAAPIIARRHMSADAASSQRPGLPQAPRRVRVAGPWTSSCAGQEAFARPSR